MKRKILLSAVATLFSASLVSAQVDFDKGGSFNLQEALSVAAPVVPAAPKAESVNKTAGGTAEWTIMVFLNGKNNLEKYGLKDFNEMEQVGSTGKVNIVVEMGRMDGYDTSDGNWTGVRRYLVKKDSDTSKVTSPVVQDLGMIDMGDYNSVIAFGKWAKEKYPAKKYMLILWNHGAGWLKAMGPLSASKGISYDDQSGNHINTPQMATILKEIGGVNVLGSDACLMQMAEVDYEVKPYVEYIVGSEETEPGDGYTYNTFLSPVVSNPTMNPETLAKTAVNAYSDHYESQDGGYTQSYVKASAIPQLLKLTNDFAYAITQANDSVAAKYGRDNAVKFAYAENKDLYHFTQLVLEKTNSADVKAKGQALMNFITGDLVGLSRSKDEAGSYWSEANPLSKAKGIAIYIPSTKVPDSYKEMQWATYSNWDEFVDWLAK